MGEVLLNSFVVYNIPINPSSTASPECAEKIDTNPFRHNLAADDYRSFQREEIERMRKIRELIAEIIILQREIVFT